MADRVSLRRTRELRTNQTDAERVFWSLVRGKSFGVRFRRQVPIGPFIVDFYCPAHRLIVELDGSQHLGSVYDRDRDDWLTRHGYRVLRFWNSDVLANATGVLERIRQVMNT